MIVKLLTEHNLEFLSFKGGCRGSPESKYVKCHIVGNHMPRLICLFDECEQSLLVLGIWKNLDYLIII